MQPIEGPFGQLVYDLVVLGDVEPEVLNDELFVGRPPGAAHRIAVVRDTPEAVRHVKQLLKAGKAAGGVELVLVGGPEQRAVELKKAVPWFTGAGIWVAHLPDGGGLWLGKGVGRGFLKKQLQNRSGVAPDWQSFTERMGRHEQAASQAAAFAGAVASRRPVVTMTLLGIIAVVYALELLWNATDYVPAAMHMGALSRAGVARGELWRLLSCTFLHGNIMHVLLNAFVLWSLGSSLEAVLGSSRFLLLYAVSAVGGSLVSLVFLGERYSVGASGAIWGLMAAQFVFAWRGRGILPEGLRARMRAGAGQNLMLNILNSLRPGVDFGAHAGGGIAGGVLMGVGLLTVGLPRWAEQPAPPPDRVPSWAHAGAALGALALAGGLGLALLIGQPWTLSAAPRLERSAVGTSGYTMDLPVGMAMTLVEASSPQEHLAGDILNDGVFIDVIMVPVPAGIPEAEIAATYDSLRDGIGKSDGTTVLDGLHRDGDGPLVGTSKLPSGLLIERSARVTATGVYRVDVLVWPETPKAWRGLAVRMLESLESP